MLLAYVLLAYASFRNWWYGDHHDAGAYGRACSRSNSLVIRVWVIRIVASELGEQSCPVECMHVYSEVLSYERKVSRLGERKCWTKSIDPGATHGSQYDHKAIIIDAVMSTYVPR